MQILAGAGTGKTEVMRQRVVSLLAQGVPPEGLVALTFNIDAGDELKRRVAQGVEAHPDLGPSYLPHLSRCYIGTIHSYCFQLLQTYIPRYENYDVLDDHRLAAFLQRIASGIKLKSLTGSLFTSISAFKKNLDVVDNELVHPDELVEPFASVYRAFLEREEQYRLITYGQQITAAIAELRKQSVFQEVHGALQHLLVDEYQDVNPAQERLIKLLSAPPVELCVVGDDDQSIYQWRGTDVNNIRTFAKRYPNVTTFRLETNRRSRPTIIKIANAFANTIEGRIPKTMRQYRKSGPGDELVLWTAATEADEAERIALTIERLVGEGHKYSDIGILLRGWVAFPLISRALTERGVPIMPGGRMGLFTQPEADLFGRTFAFLGDVGWSSEPYGPRQKVGLTALVTAYTDQFQLSNAQRANLRAELAEWKRRVPSEDKPVDLVSEYYSVLQACGVHKWDMSCDPLITAKAGTIARCTLLLKDYESIRRRSRPDPDKRGEQKGGLDRGKWYYFNLAIFIMNWAHGAYEGFEGDDPYVRDAVVVTTVHTAKGLEWPIVFVPSLSAKRFPSSKTGQKYAYWFVPSGRFDRRRYEGSQNDERRLFYVAMTRARDCLSLSTHGRVTTAKVAPSPFILDVASTVGADLDAEPKIVLPVLAANGGAPEDLLNITYSELSSFASCGYAYRLRVSLGFEAPIAPELGYGKGIHHILRAIADYARREGSPPTEDDLKRLFDEDFYLPAASRPAHLQMKESAHRLVRDFVDSYGQSLVRVWAIERPFELHVRNAVILGRADVILREEEDGRAVFEINDYKVSEDEDTTPHDRQLRVYTSAGRKEGLDVAAAHVFDLGNGEKRSVDIADQTVVQAEEEIASLVDRLREREFVAKPGAVCRRCDVKAICSFRSNGA